MIETVSNQELETRLRQHLHRLPIFPLYRVSLFPHALLPLYVFEPRYREMTEHCLSAGGSMAIATLLPGHEAEYQGRPPVRLIAGAGQVVAHRKNPDGTFNILLQGVARVRIDEELPPERTFREVRATLLPDVLPADPGEQAALDATDQLLVDLAERFATHLPRGAEALRELCRGARCPSERADALAAALVADAALRQQLLENPDVGARVEQVAAELSRMLHELSPQSSN